jgi:hypothetical protein
MNRKLKFATIAVIIAVTTLWVYRSFGTGYIWAVSGLRVPWPRETTEHFNCDYGQYSVFRLREDSMNEFQLNHFWVTYPPGTQYENDCLTFVNLKGAMPLPSQEQLIWLQGSSRHEDWTIYLHVPSRRLFVAIGHSDMAGDLPSRAKDNREGEQAAPRNR